MNGIVMRSTGNKRLLNTLPRSKKGLTSPEDNKGEKCRRYNQKSKEANLKFKCFVRHGSLNLKVRALDNETQRISDFNNNQIGRALQKSQKFILNKKPTEVFKNRKYLARNVERKFVSLDTTLEKKFQNQSNLEFKEKNRPVTLSKENSLENGHLKNPYDEGGLTELIKNSNEDSFEEESKPKHPNRRLQRERPEFDFPTKKARYSRPRSVVVPVANKHGSPEASVASEVKRASKLIKQEKDVKPSIEGISIKVEKVRQTEKNKHAGSGMWEKVLDSKHLWEEETSYIKKTYEMDDTESDENESVVDYKGLLDEFTLHTLEENDKRKTLYEKRVEKMLEDTDFINLVKEFYIPPALVEVLFHQMAQDQTAVESLRRICQVKKWPDPEFSCILSGKDGFLYSCSLKTKPFTPNKPASNEDLAKELAALECLEWLGFKQRASPGQPALQETYFP